MEALGSASSIIAVIQIAGSVAKLCGGYIADVKDARQDIARLQEKAATLRDVLQTIAEANDGTDSKPRNLSDGVLRTVKKCSQDLRELQEKLQPKTGHKTMSRVGLRALKWPLSKSSVNEEVRMIEGYLAAFNIAISNDIGRKIDQGRDDQLLQTISHIGDAAYDSYENQRHRPCLTDTRVELLREITDWATGNSSQHIFWLRGRAGTGKSTIALTMAQSLDKPNAPLASFFFKRGAGDLARSRKVITSVVLQLAMRSRYFGSLVCDTLREYPHLGDSASLSQQYAKLLLRPLQRARQSAPHPLSFIVILDALDECDDLDDIRLLLRLLGDTQDMAGLGLRVLVSSRPETPIRMGFHSMKHIVYHELALHDLPRSIVDQDIERFVSHELAQIKFERNLPHFWPENDKIHAITTRADGLFIYAATVCLYVNGPYQVSPVDRLEQVCSTSGVKHKSTEALDEMYSIVLASSIIGDFSTEEEHEFNTCLRKVVGCVVLLFDGLSAEDIARLLFPTTTTGGSKVQQILVSLHAVFDVPEGLNKPIKMQHLSFRDFLVDSARCGDIRFQIDQQQVHHDLFDRCLDLMKRCLRKNICQVSGLGCSLNEVSEALLIQHIPLGLRYACRYWISHADHGKASLSDSGPIYDFLGKYCPYWIEVMGLIRKIPEAITMMVQLGSLIEVKIAPKLDALVQDILRFMLTFNVILAESPIQLYSAGISFSPAQSIFQRSFSSLTDLHVITQLPSGWNACIQTLEGHSGGVTSAIFSPDGSRVASGSQDSTVRVWDVQTGQCQQTLEGHSDSVNSIDLLPEGSRLASGSSDKTVRVWDVQTGQCQQTLEGHSDEVTSVTFSPDGSRLASSSDDETVRMWDVQTGQCQQTLEGHSDSVTSVSFSPDGLRLASSSHDRTVRVWDVQTGQCQQTLEGHLDCVKSVTFSPDGSRVASGSFEETARLWDIQTGQCQLTLEGHLGWVSSVTFSSDGSRVASGSSDKRVRVWDVQTGQCQQTLEGHSDGVNSVVFSPDGSRVASSSYDKTVRLWDVNTDQCQQTLECHSDRVTSVSFSPDRSRVVSSSHDRTVRVWDVQKGQCQQTLEGHLDWINNVTFSPDGSRAVSGSFDNTARLWDIQTGQCRQIFEGHSQWITSSTFSPDGSRVASGSFDNTVRVWDVQTGQCQQTLEGHLNWVKSVVFSPDGSRVASSSIDKTVRVWNIASSTEVFCYDSGKYGCSIEFSDDGSNIFVDGNLVFLQPQAPQPTPTRGSRGLSCNTPISELKLKGDCIFLSDKMILWLPPEYRPVDGVYGLGGWASYDNTIVIGSETGRVTFVHCDSTHSLLL